ncbi:MAG: hypothetical protein V4687_15010 [Bacteroidota bacterium]
MKKLIFTFLVSIIAFSTANAQKGIDFRSSYPGGRKLQMYVDSSARNVFYAMTFPNLPNTFFSFLPSVSNTSFQIYFRKEDNVQLYRYTIVVDGKPTLVNQTIDTKQLKEVKREEDLFNTLSLGVFDVKNKSITVLIYRVDKPQEINTAVFYGKPIPKAKIQGMVKRLAIPTGVNYIWITDTTSNSSKINFTEKDDELTIVKDKTDLDYIYYTTLVDKKTGNVVFESRAWKYGGYLEASHELSPYIQIDKSVFKTAGDYEIIIQPSFKWTGCRNCDITPQEIEKYITRYTLSITLNQ